MGLTVEHLLQKMPKLSRKVKELFESHQHEQEPAPQDWTEWDWTSTWTNYH